MILMKRWQSTTIMENALMFELSSKQINIVVEAQHQIIDNPKKAVVNSESAFVKDIINQQDPELASAYWSWVCALERPSYLKLFNDSTIRANQALLEAVDGAITMPSWGYAGT